MKIRTAEHLSDALDQEIAWRVKELRLIRTQLANAPFALVGTASRIGVALSYAHLEGFFKAATTYFLQFLSNQSVPLGELRPCFQALCASYALRRKFSGTIPVDSVVLVSELLGFFSENTHLEASIPHRGEISTQSNLNSGVLRALLVRVGLSENMFELREKQLDEGLLRSRNHVAHGQYLECDQKEVLDWVEMVLIMIHQLRDELTNSAILKKWRIAA